MTNPIRIGTPISNSPALTNTPLARLTLQHLVFQCSDLSRYWSSPFFFPFSDCMRTIVSRGYGRTPVILKISKTQAIELWWEMRQALENVKPYKSNITRGETLNVKTLQGDTRPQFRVIIRVRSKDSFFFFKSVHHKKGNKAAKGLPRAKETVIGQ